MTAPVNSAPNAFGLSQSNIKTIGNVAKGLGAAIVVGGFFGGLPAIMPLGSLIGAGGTALQLASNLVTNSQPALAFAR